MANINDIPTALRLPSQLPLDAKLYKISASELLNLGEGDNYAYTYYRGLRVYCAAEELTYEWKPIIATEIGLLPTNFTYPDNTIVNGVDYSNQSYNFYDVTVYKQVKSDWDSVTGASEIINKPNSFPPSAHTHEIEEIISLSTILSEKESIINKNKENGYVGLDADGKINPIYLPSIAITNTFVVDSEAEMLALSAQEGDIAIRTDLSQSFILKNGGASVLSNWEVLLSPTDSVQSVFGRVGVVTAQVGDYTTNQITEDVNKRFQTDNQKLFNDATSSIQTQLNSKLTKVTSVGVERVYTINPDGSQSVKTLDSIVPNNHAASHLFGGIDEIQGQNLRVDVIPSTLHYSPINGKLDGHLKGIDIKLGQLSTTTAGLLSRVHYTADTEIVNGVTYLKTNFFGQGTTASAIRTVSVDDNQTSYFTTELISSAFVSPALGVAGNYVGQMTVMVNPNSANQEFGIEAYRCDGLGNLLPSGVTGAPIGSLGVTVIATMDSGQVQLDANQITSLQITGVLLSNVTFNVGERIRYRVFVKKIGTTGGALSASVYFGTNYNTYYDTPVQNTTDDVINRSEVLGLRNTDSLNWLKNNKQDNLGFTPENVANKNQVNGYVGLDSTGKINPSQLPALAITDTFVVSSQVAMLSLVAEVGDIAVRTDINKSFILRIEGANVLSNWQELLTPTDTVQSVFGRQGIVTAQAGDYKTSQITEDTNLFFTEPRVRNTLLTGFVSGAGIVSPSDTVLQAFQKLSGNITNATHNAVSLGIANGLSLNNQQLSLGLASGSATGALSSADWNVFNSKQNTISGTANYLTKYGSGGVVQSQVFDNGTNIGIGTATPNRTLEIKSAFVEPLILSSTHISEKAGVFFNALNNTYTPFLGANLNDIIFDTTGTERFRIKANGNLLVNTTTDNNSGAKLQVGGNITVGGGEAGSFEVPLSKKISAFNYAGNEAGYIDFQDRSSINISTRLVLGLRRTDNVLYEGMFFDGFNQTAVIPAGNVGIGVTNPVGKLEVLDNIRIANPLDEPVKLNFGWTENNTVGYIDTYNFQNGNRPNFSLQPFGGNVGIGTINPLAGLHVKKPITQIGNEFDYPFKVSSSDINKGIIIGYNDTDNYGVIASIHNQTDWTDTLINPFSGKVVIGTLDRSRGERLQVNGGGWFNGAVSCGYVDANNFRSTNFNYSSSLTVTNSFIDIGYYDDYEESVLLLHEIYDSGAPINKNFVNGEVTVHRGSTVAGLASGVYKVNTAAAYQSNLGTVIGIAGSQNSGSALWTCAYNGRKYFCLRFTEASARGFSFKGDYGSSPGGEILKLVKVRNSQTGTLYNSTIQGTLNLYLNPAASQLYGSLEVSSTISAVGGNSNQWNTAFGWGNHSGLYLPLSGGTLSGSITAPAFYQSSDYRLKNIIRQEGEYIEYTWKDGRDTKTHYGVIAQQVQDRNLVTVDDNGFESVNYIEFLVKKVAILESKLKRHGLE